MGNKSTIAIILLLPLCQAAPGNVLSQDQFSGFIAGRVVDQTNRPVAKARVCAQALGLPWTGPLPCGRSDRSGRFRIHIWRPARYTISAEKESDGYPDPTNAFYGSAFGSLPVLNVDQPHKTYTAVVQVGPRAGRIVGRFIDAASGRPVESALAKFCRVDRPDLCWSISTGFRGGRFRFLTPEVPFTLQVSIWSGGDWQACEISGEEVKSLDVGLNRTKVISARLRPVT